MDKEREFDGRRDSSSACGGAAEPASAREKAANPSASPDGEMGPSRNVRRILVMSGKGGVGKSTVAVHLALALARAGRRTGLLDVDIHGPSVPKMLGLEEAKVGMRDGLIVPPEAMGVKAMSIAFLLENRDDAVIWRGPMKMGIIEKFIKQVDWGELDCLVIDAPPGTGDEPLSVAQLAAPLDGVVIVTTPQDVATADVRRSLAFCRQLDLEVIGVVENMSGFVCPHCGEVTDIFKSGGGERMAREAGVPFLGRIPLDPSVAEAGDRGEFLMDRHAQSATGQAWERMVAPLLRSRNA